LGGAGGGTVTSFSSGDLAPLFTTSETNPTTTPALSFALSNAAANTGFGDHTGSPAAPVFQSLVNAQLPATLSSKTLDNSCSIFPKVGNFIFEDNTTSSKKGQFSCANVPTSTTRVINVAGTANSTSVVPDAGA